MKTAIVIVLTFTLCSCAMNPADLRERGTREQITLRQVPEAAAACAARNAENKGNWFSGHWNTAVRSGSLPGHVDFVIFSGPHFIVTADFAPAGTGSLATVWISPHIYGVARDDWMKTFRDC